MDDFQNPLPDSVEFDNQGPEIEKRWYTANLIRFHDTGKQKADLRTALT